MRYLLTILIAIAPFTLHANPAIGPFNLPSPPENASTGATRDNVRIGLWSEKSTYSKDETRNVWIFARKTAPSGITIGVGGSLFRDSFLYIYHDSKLVKKIPQTGGADGMTDGVSIAGGISQQLADLSPGTYTLIWKTRSHESNPLAITFR